MGRDAEADARGAADDEDVGVLEFGGHCDVRWCFNRSR